MKSVFSHSSSLSVTLFYTICLSFLGGVVFATFLSPTWPTLVWLMFFVAVLAILWRRNQAVYPTVWLVVTVALLGLVCGAARLTYTTDSFHSSPLAAEVGKAVVLTGVVVREPDVRENITQLFVAVEEETVLVSVDRFVVVEYGDAVTVSGTLTLPESFATDFGRTFNYPGYLLAKGVEYTVPFATVTVTGTNNANPLLAALFTAKKKFIASLGQFVPEPEAGLAAGLLLGVKKALGADLETVFRETGIIHIVVLSGYNIMLIVVFVMYVLRSLLPLRPRVIVGIGMVSLFALMVGLSATVLRASLMAILVLVAEAFSRQYLVLRSLVFVLVVMVFINPLIAVYDIGFQLSFLATLGLIVGAPLLSQWCRFPSWLTPVGIFFYATIATQLAVLPLLLYYMGEVSVVAVLVNMIVLPLVPVAMLLSALVAGLGLFWPAVAGVAAIFAVVALSYIIVVAKWFAALPFAAVAVPLFPFYYVILLYVVLMIFTVWCYRHSRVVGESELGERLLVHVVSTRTVPEDVTAWTIEEENDEEIKAPDVARKATSGATAETPIFFR